MAAFEINSAACGNVELYLAKCGCRSDVFRTFKGVIVVMGEFALDPNHETLDLLGQLKQQQYEVASNRIYYIPFESIASVAGGDLRTTARADGFPTSIAENVPQIGATISSSLKTIYTHKQLRKLNTKYISFYAVTDSNLILGETDSRGLLLPTSGLLWKYLYMPIAEGGAGETADLMLYYENVEALGNDIAFAELPKEIRLDKELQQLMEIKLEIVEVIPPAETTSPAEIHVRLITPCNGENVSSIIEDSIQTGEGGAGQLILKNRATGEDVTGVISYNEANDYVVVQSSPDFSGAAVLSIADPLVLIAENVGSIDDGTYAGEPVNVTIPAGTTA